MSSYNRVTLIGNLTRNLELRKTKSGNSVTEMGIALNRVWQNESGQKQEEVTFVDVTLWGRNAENAVQYLQKGRSVLVEGRLQLESWQDKESGQDRSKLKVVADHIQFLGGAHDHAAASGEEAPAIPSPPSGTGEGQGERGSRDTGEGRQDERARPESESPSRRPDDRRANARHQAA